MVFQFMLHTCKLHKLHLLDLKVRAHSPTVDRRTSHVNTQQHLRLVRFVSFAAFYDISSSVKQRQSQ